MAFPTNEPLTSVFPQVQRLANRVKEQADSFIITSAGGNTTGQKIFDLFITLKSANDVFNIQKATPGIAQYAKDQLDNQAIDIATEFTTMQAALVSVLNEIIVAGGAQTLFPTIAGNGDITYPSFTSGQTNNIRLLLQSLSDTIG